MRQPRPWTGLLLATAALLLGPVGPATAAVRGRIISLEAVSGRLHVVFSPAGLGANESIDPTTVRLTLDGKPLDATVKSDAQAVATVVRRVILAIDTSGSMTTDDRIGSARKAALAFLARVPPDVEVGLVTFSDTATVAVNPTTDRGVVSSAVRGLSARGNTALYDAVRRAVAVLGTEGDRSVLVLSDGKDEGSRTSLASDVDELQRAKIPVNAVLLGDVGAKQALTALSNAAGGRVVSAQATDDLTKAFVEQARVSEKEVTLSAVVPEGYTGGSAPVTVTAMAAGQTITDTAVAVNLVSDAVAAKNLEEVGPRPVKHVSGLLTHKTVLWIGLLALFVGVGVLLAVALVGVGNRPQTMRSRLSPYVDTLVGRKKEKQPRSVRETAVGIADELVRRRGLEERLGRKLDAGGVPLKPAEWLILHISFALLFPMLMALITDLNPALSITAVVVGITGPFGYLAVKESIRIRKFLAQLPDTLQLLAGSLSSGYSLPQAVDAVVRQGNAPMADELRKALVEARLGAPIEDALDDVADRMGSKDFHWVVMAIRIQRQVGGNLAEVLATTAATLRERERIRRQVQVLSAEGRLSAYVLFGLPVFFALYLMATRAYYLKPLVTDPIGWIMLAGMGILLTVGAFWLRKVVKVEV